MQSCNFLQIPNCGIASFLPSQDETTSALDASREVRLHKLLLSALSSTTLIAVTHRLANIVSYDRVLVMGDGREALQHIRGSIYVIDFRSLVKLLVFVAKDFV